MPGDSAAGPVLGVASPPSRPGGPPSRRSALRRGGDTRSGWPWAATSLRRRRGSRARRGIAGRSAISRGRPSGRGRPCRSGPARTGEELVEVWPGGRPGFFWIICRIRSENSGVIVLVVASSAGRGCSRQVLVQQLVRRVGPERRPAAGQFIAGDAEAVNVGRGRRRLAADLLGRHVAGRPLPGALLAEQLAEARDGPHAPARSRSPGPRPSC